MPNEASSSEISRPAKIAKAVYLSAAVIGGALVAVSVIVELWFPTRPAHESRAAQPSVAEQMECNREVSRLLDALGGSAAVLFAVPTEAQLPAPVSRRWTQFSRQWRRDWESVGQRCQFDELQDQRMGVGYDRMARVHDDLRAAYLRYNDLVRRFDNEQVDQLVSMRRALEKSKLALERRTR